jgi:hypothetical protein
MFCWNEREIALRSAADAGSRKNQLLIANDPSRQSLLDAGVVIHRLALQLGPQRNTRPKACAWIDECVRLGGGANGFAIGRGWTLTLTRISEEGA